MNQNKLVYIILISGIFIIVIGIIIILIFATNNNREKIPDEDDVEIVDSYDNTKELIKIPS